jgi:hypothetical protein
MDAIEFDHFTRSLGALITRRRGLGVLTALGAGLAISQAEAGKGKKNKKKKKRKKNRKKNQKNAVCQPQCSGRTCGSDGCGGSCGECSGELVCTAGKCQCPAGEGACGAGCCGTCQACDDARKVCVMAPDSDETPCPGGACCGGACCPPTCNCGLSGLSSELAEVVAEYLNLPYPLCVAPGTGQMCGIGGSACPAGTTCQPISGGFAVCIGTCPGVDYPSI